MTNDSAEGLGDVYRLVPSLTLATRGADALRQMVLNGVLRPGERLNEVELSAALGISRAPLREAIRQLASQGLLTIFTHKGAFVPCYDVNDLTQIYDVRAALESYAANLVAQRRSASELVGLVQMVEGAEVALEGSRRCAYPVELDFHRELVRLTGNLQLQQAAEGISQKVQLARIRSGHSPERAREALDEHRQIYTCLLARDGEGAANLIFSHLRKSLENALSVENGITGPPFLTVSRSRPVYTKRMT